MLRKLLNQKREAVFLVLLLLCSVYIGLELRVETSMARLLPPTTQELSELAQDVIDSTAARTMVLSIGPAANAPLHERQSASTAALEVAARMERVLAKHPEVSWIQSGPDPKLQHAVWDSYFSRRFNFVAPDATALKRRLDAEGIRASVQDLKRQLGSPAGPLVRQVAPRDPLLLFNTQVERLSGFQPAQLKSVERQFLSSDGHAILFLGLVHSALNGTLQRPLLEHIQQTFVEQRGGHEALVLERSGINLFAVASETRIKSDISRVALLSTLGILIVFVALFRSATSLLVAFLPMLSAFVAALAVCNLLFGEVHALTLAFGASLLGVCIDYPLHLMNHRGLSGDDTRLPLGLRKGLCLGALTTVAGISMLGFTGFSVMQQVAVFSAAGLTTALAVTLLILPRWVGVGRLTFRRKLAQELVRLVQWLERRRRWALLVCTIPAVLGAVGISRASWANSLEGLAPLDPALRLEDGRVRSRVGAPGNNELVLAVGSTEAEALTRNENAFAALRIAEQQGLIKGFQSLHTLLPSAAWQRTNFDAIRSEQTLSELKQALSAEGFSLESFRPFFEEQHEARFRALTLGDLRGTALGPWAERFVVQNPERTAVLSFPHLTRDPASLAQRLKPLPGVHFIDQRSLLDSAYTKLRQRVSLLVLLGAACMVLVIGLRFRNFRSSIATLVPALIAPTAALGALALLGVQLNLFHLFAALVVLSMAMDYGIFLSESVSSPQHLSSGGTLLSILVAGITSCLSFGLLGFSTVPVLAALGQTVGLGILTALAAAPLTLLLQRRSAALLDEA